MKQRCLREESLGGHAGRSGRAMKAIGARHCRAPTFSYQFIRVNPWFPALIQAGYCAAKTRRALPGVPAPNTYPEPTNTMPPATVGPGAAIEPPLAGT
jgi:hypothetical protein